MTFIGSDGQRYSFLCKPKDDLRRDCRLGDFNNLLNKLFMRDPECRKRDLRIRTYKVRNFLLVKGCENPSWLVLVEPQPSTALSGTPSLDRCLDRF